MMYQQNVPLDYIAQALVMTHVVWDNVPLRTSWVLVRSKGNNQMSNVAPADISMLTFKRLHQLPKTHSKHNIL